MLKQIPVFLTSIKISIMQPLLAVAQTTTKPDAPQQPQWPYGHGPWHMWGDHHHGWHFWWIPLLMIFFIVMFFVAMRRRAGGRWDMPPWQSRDTSASAIEILNERFARGEIDEKEYKDKKTKILST